MRWQGAPGVTLPVVSGGIVVPRERFQPWAQRSGVFVASLAGLNASNLGAMVSGNCVADCQHDKVGVSWGGEALTLARWPNRDEDGQWQWAHADVDPGAPPTAAFTLNTSATPDASRVLRWAEEADAFLHGYFSADWCDGYARLAEVSRTSPDIVRLAYAGDGAAACRPWSRWMGVNLLCELDAPGEFFVDAKRRRLYLFPPGSGARAGAAWPPIALMHQPGAVVNVSSRVRNATLSRLEVRDGRHAGVSAHGARGLTLDGLVVHAVGTHGVDLADARDSAVLDTDVFDTGCSGIRATGGVAATLERGNLRVAGNRVRRHAQWKRAYQPGVFWAGVGNVFESNVVQDAPHNCFLGGGDFGDGVDNRFENNSLLGCALETLDTGGFYTCGQAGSAFVNRGNVLTGNTFARVRNNGSCGCQCEAASNQAVYLDDQMSGWEVTNNTFTDCQVRRRGPVPTPLCADQPPPAASADRVLHRRRPA